MRNPTSWLRLALGLTSLYSIAVAQGTRTGPPPIPVVPSKRLQLLMALPSRTVKLGAPVLAKFTLRNTSATAITVGVFTPEYNYELTVTDASGKELPRTPLGERLLRRDGIGGSTTADEIDPGREIEAALDISRIYQLTSPGTYLVRAVRNAILGDRAEMEQRARNPGERPSFVEEAISNVVQFTITQ